MGPQLPPGVEEISGERTPLTISRSQHNDDRDISLDPSDSDVSDDVLGKARRLLYFSHFFNQFSEGSWQFCLILFLAALSNYQSLLLVSTYGLTSGLGICLFGASAGKFVDASDRLLVAQRFICLENVCVLLATIICYLLLTNQADEHQQEQRSSFGVPTDPRSLILLVGVHVLGASAAILDSGFLVAVERDWIVVMSQALQSSPNHSTTERLKRRSDWLRDTNVMMTQIDLSCQIVAPAVAGMFVALWDPVGDDDATHRPDLRGAALLIGGVNCVALLVEYLCTLRIYNEIPALSIKSAPSSREYDSEESMSRNLGCVGAFSSGLTVYLDQRISFAGLALSLLYLNILSFGGVMTAYLVWRGMRLETIGVWRGVSSAVGLAGTFVFHFLSKRISLVETGMIAVVYQFCSLSLSYASLFIEDNTTSLTLLIAGVCSSRIGLWVFDISVTQLMQLSVPEHVRGLVGGVQKSLNAFFAMLSFALGLWIPDPQNFHVYVSMGYVSVAAAVLCFAFGVFARKSEFDHH